MTMKIVLSIILLFLLLSSPASAAETPLEISVEGEGVLEQTETLEQSVDFSASTVLVAGLVIAAFAVKYRPDLAHKLISKTIRRK
jgi:hypothetical protein